jgi:glutamine cyclotransferase
MKSLALIACLILAFLVAQGWAESIDSSPTPPIPVYSYKIVKTYPHDQGAFTEGLVYEDGFIFEGTGLSGESSLRKVDLESGKILAKKKIADKLFGEGIAVYKDRIIQLTYLSRLGFVYDKNSFKVLRKFSYATEGWGLTYDGKDLILSDGTEKLYFLDPESLKVKRSMEVRDNKGAVKGLNELEFIKGEIYANIYPTDTIAIINPETGKISGWIELKGLLDPSLPCDPRCSLNGIAYDAKNDRLFVTGKYYPKIFEIKLVPVENR